MAILQKPEIGRHIGIVTDWSDYFAPFADNVRRTRQLEGYVVASESYDDAGTFRLRTALKYNPVAVVTMARVVQMVDLEAPTGHGDPTNEASARIENLKVAPEQFSVDGSTGNNYTVTKDGASFNCDCKAGQMGRACKHIVTVRQRLGV